MDNLLNNEIKKIKYDLNQLLSFINKMSNNINAKDKRIINDNINELFQKIILIEEILCKIKDEDIPNIIDNINYLKIKVENIPLNKDIFIREIPDEIKKEIDKINENIKSLSNSLNVLDTENKNLSKRIQFLANQIRKQSEQLKLTTETVNNNKNEIEELKKISLSIQKTINELKKNTNEQLAILINYVELSKNTFIKLEETQNNFLKRIRFLAFQVGNQDDKISDILQISDNNSKTILELKNNDSNMQLKIDEHLNQFINYVELSKITLLNIEKNLNNLKSEFDNKTKIYTNDIINLNIKIDGNYKIFESNSNLLNKNIIDVKTDLGKTKINLQNSNIQINENTVKINNLLNSLSYTSNNLSLIYNPVNKENTNKAYFNEIEINNAVIKEITMLSDKNLKKNIKNINNPEKILKLNAKTYQWKSNNSSDIGFIAQDVEKIFPEMVITNNGIKSVKYVKFIPLIIEQLKYQNKQIFILKILIGIIFLILFLIIVYKYAYN